MKRELIFAASFALGVVGLTACSKPDMADALYFDCQLNHDSPARKELLLEPGQGFQLANNNIRAISAGRISINSATNASIKELNPDSVVIRSARLEEPYTYFRLAVNAASSEAGTRLVVTYNCKDGSNP